MCVHELILSVSRQLINWRQKSLKIHSEAKAIQASAAIIILIVVLVLLKIEWISWLQYLRQKIMRHQWEIFREYTELKQKMIMSNEKILEWCVS